MAWIQNMSCVFHHDSTTKPDQSRVRLPICLVFVDNQQTFQWNIAPRMKLWWWLSLPIVPLSLRVYIHTYKKICKALTLIRISNQKGWMHALNHAKEYRLLP